MPAPKAKPSTNREARVIRHVTFSIYPLPAPKPWPRPVRHRDGRQSTSFWHMIGSFSSPASFSSRRPPLHSPTLAGGAKYAGVGVASLFWGPARPPPPPSLPNPLPLLSGPACARPPPSRAAASLALSLEPLARTFPLPSGCGAGGILHRCRCSPGGRGGGSGTRARRRPVPPFASTRGEPLAPPQTPRRPRGAEASPRPGA